VIYFYLIFPISNFVTIATESIDHITKLIIRIYILPIDPFSC
jgi:hypothetical protein